PTLRIYSVPENSFESEGDTSDDDDNEQPHEQPQN
ncbi:unnamed protein product, partial [Rotaria magnacalcarata]